MTSSQHDRSQLFAGFAATALEFAGRAKDPRDRNAWEHIAEFWRDLETLRDTNPLKFASRYGLSPKHLAARILPPGRGHITPAQFDVEIRCHNCGQEAAETWQLNFPTEGELETQFISRSGEFYERLSKCPPYHIEAVCRRCRSVLPPTGHELISEAHAGEILRTTGEMPLRTRGPAPEISESELRQRLFSSIVEFSDDAIVSKDLEGVILSWNRGAGHVFGYTPEEAIGRSITIVIPEDRQSEEREILTRIARGERIEHFETIRRRKDGDLITVSLSVSPVKDEHGRIVGAAKIARDITEQKRNQDLIASLAREAEHRSKNLLASIQAIVNLSRADTPEDLKQTIQGRIMALANVVSLFVESRWIGADLAAIATQELAAYSAKGESHIRMSGPPILLEPSTAQALAMTLHELATNAAKYGALSVPNGQIGLSWTRETDGRLRLRWSEAGGPEVVPPTRRGFGGRIIEQVIGQLKGQVFLDWRKGGLVCEITIPM